MRALLMLIGLLSIGQPLAASGTGSAASTDPIGSALARYQQMTRVPVAELDAEALARIADGDIVYRKVMFDVEDGDGGHSTAMRIIGYRIIDQPREPLWLAALAFDGGYSPRLTEHLIETRIDGGSRWYQHVNMPWPLRDRHWVIDTAKGLAVARATGGRIWEHHWQLAADAEAQIQSLINGEAIAALSPRRMSGAIRLPRNDGAWVMVELSDDSTLVMLHATMDMGGIIPDGLVNRYTKSQLSSMLERVEANATTVFEHYDERYIIFSGEGEPIPPRLPASADVRIGNDRG